MGKNFELGPVDQDISFEVVFFSTYLVAIGSAGENHLGSFDGGQYGEHFCEIILNLA